MVIVPIVSFMIWKKREDGRWIGFGRKTIGVCSCFRTNLGVEVDITDLTWEQKEQVLRALFLRMNSKRANE